MEIHGRSCREEGNGPIRNDEIIQPLDELFTQQSKCIDKPELGLLEHGSMTEHEECFFSKSTAP